MGLHSKLITFKSANNTLSGLALKFINVFNIQEKLNKPFGKNFRDLIAGQVRLLFTESSANDFYINLESLKENFTCSVLLYCLSKFGFC